MRLLAACLIGMTSLLTPTDIEAGPGQLSSRVAEVHAYLFDGDRGAWDPEDLFGSGYDPFNRLAVPLLLVVTVDFGETCVVRPLSPLESQAVVKGERPAVTRPITCDRPPGEVIAAVKYSDGVTERQRTALAKFFVGFDGRVRIPILFYRRQQCLPMEVAVRTSSSRVPLVNKVEFTCNE